MLVFSPEKMAEQRKNHNENLECFSPKHKTEFVQFSLNNLSPINEFDHTTTERQRQNSEKIEEIQSIIDQKFPEKTFEVEDVDGPEIKLVSGGFKLGKTEHTCEDAYFICDRGFGVADGVSGWVEYGFSSMAFSHSLMDKCRE